MKFGFSLIVRGNEATPDTFARIAERAEALEIDSLWCSAHVIVPPQVKSGYILIPGRKHPEHWKECYWEPFTVLSYLAALTSKITLGTSVVIVPMHNPIELAKQVAEVDQLSGGRFVFGVGVGWFEEEVAALRDEITEYRPATLIRVCDEQDLPVEWQPAVARRVAREISLELATRVLKTLIWKDMAYDDATMPEERAKSLTSRFMALFTANARCYTNANWADHDGARMHSWGPVTGATFDSGIVIRDGKRIGVLWFEDED